MKAVILAGGLGTRISEETSIIPKPMVKIGGKPILWHIMKIYSYYGINDFIICLGYKGEVIKDYFLNYKARMGDITMNIREDKISFHYDRAEPWTISLIDTGSNSMTGGRIRRIKEYVKNEDAFCLTYGDGLCDINITDLVDFHFKQRTYATLTAISPPERFGVVEIAVDSRIKGFKEKPAEGENYVNGGYFVLSPKIFEYIDNDNTIWEKDSLPILAKEDKLVAYRHSGFWQCMDTLRDKNYLNQVWDSGKAPWKVFD